MENVNKLYTREVKESIDSLVDENGYFNFGTYKSVVKNVNMLDAKKPLGIFMPRLLKSLKLKEWEAFEAGNADFFILGAVYNLKTIALNQIFVYDKKNKRSYNFQKICPALEQTIGCGLLNSTTKYESEDYTIIFNNNLENGEINIFVDIREENFKLDVTAYHNTEPIVTCQPLGENRGLYSHKALMPMEGVMNLGNKKVDFELKSSFAIIDDHKGYYPSPMEYDWVTGCKYDENGSLTGFNLTDNQVIDKENYNENCLWINGKMKILPPVKVQREYTEKPVWRIKDEYGMVNILFYPETKFEVKFDIKLLYCDYEGPMGYFEGYIKTDEEIIDMKNFFGMGEKKRYKL